MRLLLVRHGETAWNADRRLQGRKDIPLSSRGRAQARALVPMVDAMAPDHVIASPLSRTVSTSRILGFGQPVLDERWQEADLGTWTGKSTADLLADGDAYARWRAGRLTPPGAETFELLTKRVVQAVEELSELAGTVLVVTHGGPIRAVCRHYVGLEPNALVPADPASLTILDFSDRARLRTYSTVTTGAGGNPPD